jgi:peptide/nickel transport system substrate-binding protein
MTKRNLLFFFGFCGLFFLAGCKGTAEESGLQVTVRLQSEPESLHPIFSKSAYATQIESLILLPLAEYDPVTMALSPLLLTQIPVGEKVLSGDHANGIMYRLQLRENATWDDGKPVTAEDYLFTIKCVYNPYVSAPTYKGLFDYISEIKTDPANPKIVDVYFDSTFAMALQTCVNFNLYPSHVYDPQQIMARYSLNQLRNDTTLSPEQDSLFRQFAASFESVTFLRDSVIGCGPYRLDSWATGEYIRLKRKKEWWGDAIQDPPLLMRAYPDEITYRIILDAAAAEAALKAGEIDILPEVPPADFIRMKADSSLRDRFQFSTPSLMQIYYLELNTRDSILADKRVRQALAYSVDYDGIVREVLQGLADQAVGPIHPDRDYYDASLQPLDQDINRAIALLKDAGWTDTNNNGTPDKVVNGKREELSLAIKIQNKEEGSTIANIVKENAAKAGFDLQIEIVEPGQFNQDIRQRNFDLLPIRIRAFPGIDNVYQQWHSDSDAPGGGNRSGFHSEELDAVINEIQTTTSDEVRDKAFKRFQQIIYNEQPAIWLYAPLERIIATKRLSLIPSSRRPGYFENLLKTAD